MFDQQPFKEQVVMGIPPTPLNCNLLLKLYMIIFFIVWQNLLQEVVFNAQENFISIPIKGIGEVILKSEIETLTK